MTTSVSHLSHRHSPPTSGGCYLSHELPLGGCNGEGSGAGSTHCARCWPSVRRVLLLSGDHHSADAAIDPATLTREPVGGRRCLSERDSRGISREGHNEDSPRLNPMAQQENQTRVTRISNIIVSLATVFKRHLGVESFNPSWCCTVTMQTNSMDPEALLSTLTDEKVVETVGDEVRLTDAFRKRRGQLQSAVADGEQSFDDVEAACEMVATEVDDHLVSTAAAVADSADFDPTSAAASALALARIENPPRDGGTPEGFTAIRGEEVEAFLARNPKSILYFWGQDCDPCAVVKADLEELQAENRIPSDLGLAAVCGDDCYGLIREKYDVAAAPTTVFCTNGGPDARLIGAHQKATVASEIEIITKG